MGEISESNDSKTLGEALLSLPSVKKILIKKNDRVFRQEANVREADKGMFYIIQGRMRVVILDTSGRERVLCVHRSGEFIGEATYLRKGNYIASTYADVDTTLLRLDSEACSTIIYNNPDICLEMLRSMSKKIDILVEQLTQATFYSIKERLACNLITLMDDFGEETEEGVRINQVISDSELAEFVGNCREAVNRQLRVMKDMGILMKKNLIFIFLIKKRCIDWQGQADLEKSLTNKIFQ